MTSARRFTLRIGPAVFLPVRTLTRDEWLALMRVVWHAVSRPDMTEDDLLEQIRDAGLADVFLMPPG